MPIKIARTFCQHCHMGCPLSVTVEDGKITSIAHHSCEKGRYCAEVVYHPDRIIYPLKRAGWAMPQPMRKPVMAYIFDTPLMTTSLDCSKGLSM